ncbi:MAG: hypothetical protein EX266_17710, partial [Rhodobacteraceae bacterium]
MIYDAIERCAEMQRLYRSNGAVKSTGFDSPSTPAPDMLNSAIKSNNFLQGGGTRIMSSGSFGISQHVLRREDQNLITGAGNYSDDTRFEGQTFVAFLRSPVAHAAITSIDLSAAKAAPGVIGAFTGEDLRAAGIGDIPNMTPFANHDGSPMHLSSRPALAVGKVHHVGEIVAMVIAET